MPKREYLRFSLAPGTKDILLQKIQEKGFRYPQEAFLEWLTTLVPKSQAMNELELHYLELRNELNKQADVVGKDNMSKLAELYKSIAGGGNLDKLEEVIDKMKGIYKSDLATLLQFKKWCIMKRELDRLEGEIRKSA